MDPASRPALQRSICQWSLPQHVVWMPMCLGRLHSASHVDDLHCRIRRRLRLCSTAAYRLEASLRAAFDGLHASMCTCRVERSILRGCSCDRMSVGPIHTVKTHVWCTENARALHKSEYAVSLIHHMRPLNRQETHGFCKSRDPRFRPRAVLDRATSALISWLAV